MTLILIMMMGIGEMGKRNWREGGGDVEKRVKSSERESLIYFNFNWLFIHIYFFFPLLWPTNENFFNLIFIELNKRKSQAKLNNCWDGEH